MTMELAIKVYYEDTDCLGMVYHANYLKYFERGRSEMLAALGKTPEQWNAEGANFVVFKMNITWHKPGKLGDALRVLTARAPHRSPFRFVLDQKILRGEELLCEAEVHVVCLDREMKLRRVPAELISGA